MKFKYISIISLLSIYVLISGYASNSDLSLKTEGMLRQAPVPTRLSEPKNSEVLKGKKSERSVKYVAGFDSSGSDTEDEGTPRPVSRARLSSRKITEGLLEIRSQRRERRLNKSMHQSSLSDSDYEGSSSETDTPLGVASSDVKIGDGMAGGTKKLVHTKPSETLLSALIEADEEWV